MIKVLTKENFWDEQIENFPISMGQFRQYIDQYKKDNNWDGLFNAGDRQLDDHFIAPKYHDLPYAMQVGIFFDWLYEVDNVLPPQYNKDIRLQITAVLSRLENQYLTKAYKEYIEDGKIEITGVIVERGRPDSSGDYIDTSALVLDKKVPVRVNYSEDPDSCIGEAILDYLVLQCIKRVIK